ncbi:MAG: hypothetical protein HQM10_11415 [Candidatus Riflebacteria bacterium]|nr:hypothetical protein [Candidatus Riflebacteria bacterium]
MRILTIVALFLFLVFPCFADISATQWETDLTNYNKYLNSTPQEYLAAIELNKKWIGFYADDSEKVKSIPGIISLDQLQANMKGIYDSAAQAIINDYSSFITADISKAAKLGIAVRNYYRENDSAALNRRKEMQLNMAIRKGFMDIYVKMANDYSTLAKAGKTAEAEALSKSWNILISDLGAQGSGLVDDFKNITSVDLAKVVSDVKAFEVDHRAYTEAIKNYQFDKALALLKKWEDFAKENPSAMGAVNFIFNASIGAKIKEKKDWTAFCAEERARVYASMFDADVKEYEKAIADGKLASATALIDKWDAITDGDLGADIASKLKVELKTFKENLEKEKAKIEAIDPNFSSENVASFKTDLAEYNQCIKDYQAAEVGSDAWYNNLARGMELADKWSKIANQNTALANEILKATGIQLPKASDDVINFLLDTSMNDSAAKFNSYLGSGKYTKGKELVRGWKDYLNNHTRVKELALKKWGNDTMATLDRYEVGLTIMAGFESATSTETSVSTSPDPTTENAPPTVDPAVNTSGNETGLGPSAQ